MEEREGKKSKREKRKYMSKEKLESKRVWGKERKEKLAERSRGEGRAIKKSKKKRKQVQTASSISLLAKFDDKQVKKHFLLFEKLTLYIEFKDIVPMIFIVSSQGQSRVQFRDWLRGGGGSIWIGTWKVRREIQNLAEQYG